MMSIINFRSKVYTIWIVRTPELDVAGCFEEIAIALRDGLRQLGFEASIVYDAKDVRGVCLVLAARALHFVPEPLPENLIIYNLEQLDDGMFFNSSVESYTGILERFPIWDYAQKNIDYLAQRGINIAAHCPLGYVESLTRIAPAKHQDIDVLFYGTPHPRRQAILDQLQERGLTVKFLHYVFGKQRDDYIARSKLVLNMHMQPAALFEVARVSYLLANHVCVVSETGSDHDLEEPYKNGIAFAHYDGLVGRCVELLADSNTRHALAKKGREIVAAMPQAEYLRAAIAQHEASQASAPASKPTIFVALPSYLDPECVPTVKRLFAHAKHPERIRVGVCWQTNADMGKFPYDALNDYASQLSVVECDAADAKGANWARRQACDMAGDADYVLLMDSHMYPLPGWDDLLLMAHAELAEDKALITDYCPPYDPPAKLYSGKFTNRRVVVDHMGTPGDPQLVHLNRQILEPADPRDMVYYPSPFVVHHFIFGAAEVFKQLPIDPNIHFWGDELTLSARLWTHGYTLYQLPKFASFHQWNHREKTTPSRRVYRRIDNKRSADNAEYVKQVIGLEHRSDVRLKPDYALGTERDMATFWRYAGVDMARQTIDQHGKNGLWDLSVLDEPGAESPLKAKPATRYLAARANCAKQMANASSNPSAAMPPAKITENNDEHTQPWLICIAADDHEALVATLGSLFANAANPARLRVCVGWQPGSEVRVPGALRPYVKQIEISDVALPNADGNGLHATLVRWSNEAYTLLLRAGVMLEPGWDQTLARDLATLPTNTLLSAIAAKRPGKHKHIRAIAATGSAAPLLIQPRPCDANAQTSGQTPLLSLDLLAGRSADMLRCPPDAYMHGHALAVAHAARLWTHGVDIAQPSAPLLYDDRPENVSPHQPKPAMISRALHIAGLALADDETSLQNLERYDHGDSRSVESFWKAAGVNVEDVTIHPKALKGEWSKLIAGKVKLDSKNMVQRSKMAKGNVAPQQNKSQSIAAQPVNTHISNDDGSARIFVQIASYRDQQCQYTVQDLFAKAAHSDRIFVGIAWQTIADQDKGCFNIVTRPEQVRAVHFDANQSKGANWARVQAGTLRQGEEYTLLIDAHMRFEPGWDSMLIDMIAAAPSPKTVISTYPTPYDPETNECMNHYIIRMAYREFVDKKDSGAPVLKYQSKRISRQDWPSKPFVAGTLSSNFIFATSRFFDDVPIDPHIYFFGDDLSLMVRGWTHGWDVFSPHKPVLFHLWDRKTRPQHWEDNEDYNTLARKTDRRVAHLTGMQRLPSTAPALINIEQYGLGNVRSLRAFEVFAGISFANRVVSAHAKSGKFSMQLANSQGALTDGQATPAQMIAQSEASALMINPKKPLVLPKAPMVKAAAQALAASSYNGPIKTLQTPEIVVYDDFLPEEAFEKLYQHSVMSDYKHINTTGNVARVWNIDNGFPLRSSWNRHYRVPGHGKKSEHDYPQNKPTDAFIEQINHLAPEVQQLIGAPGVHWAHFSATSWLYPQNTGLSLHNDGSGVYSGAYVYYLNKEWRIHWGGLLMVMDSLANQAMEQHKVEHNAHQFHHGKWLHETEHNDYAMEAGFARAIFPKRNRIVFIAPDAYHIVTKVLPAAGDNVRMTLAGFFNRGPLGKKQARDTGQAKQHPLDKFNQQV